MIFDSFLQTLLIFSKLTLEDGSRSKQSSSGSSTFYTETTAAAAAAATSASIAGPSLKLNLT